MTCTCIHGGWLAFGAGVITGFLILPGIALASVVAKWRTEREQQRRVNSKLN